MPVVVKLDFFLFFLTLMFIGRYSLKYKGMGKAADRVLDLENQDFGLLVAFGLMPAATLLLTMFLSYTPVKMLIAHAIRG